MSSLLAYSITVGSPCVMYLQYPGGCSLHLGDIEYTRGYHEYTRGCSAQWGDTMTTQGGYHKHILGI